MHPRSARRLNVGTLNFRPILIMADRQENLVTSNELGTFAGRIQAFGIDAGDVAHVIAVGLQPMNGRYLHSKKEILRARKGADPVAGSDRAVVTYLVGTAIGRAGAPAIKTISAPAIIGVPGGVRRLKDDVMRVPSSRHDEGNMVLALSLHLGRTKCAI